MITYQDFEKEKDKPSFVNAAISMHQRSEEYQIAADAEEYFRGRNATISKFQKVLYTVTGQARPDMWGADYKLKSSFFKRFILQETQFLLGNGVNWANGSEPLGKHFDSTLKKALKKARIHGASYGFWNHDHLELFDFLHFVPLLDEQDGRLRAGVKFWRIDKNRPLMATLFEADGYTDFAYGYFVNDEVTSGQISEKKPYKFKIRSTKADGDFLYSGENYSDLPIMPLYSDEYHQSAIVGLREQIDCFDLIKSGFANTVDEASVLYWTLTNAGGMDDIDLAQFVQRLKTLHAATLQNQEQVEAHSIDVPYQSRKELLERLDNDLHKDMMALDVDNIASGSATATEIKAAYEPLNSKTDDIEYQVIDFVDGILKIAGKDESYSFTRSMIINTQENIQCLLQASQYLPSEYITRKLLEYLGDGDQAEDVLKMLDEEEISRFKSENGQDEEDITENEETI